MLFLQTTENKYMEISDYIYNNFDVIILKIDDNKKYLKSTEDLIHRYKIIWQDLDYKRIISNIIALNLFIINNYE